MARTHPPPPPDYRHPHRHPARRHRHALPRQNLRHRLPRSRPSPARHPRSPRRTRRRQMVLHRPDLLDRYARRHLHPIPHHRRSLGRTHRHPHRTRPRHPRPRPHLHGSLPRRCHPIAAHLRRRRDGNDRRTKPPLLAAHRLHLRLTSLPPILPPPLLPRRRHTL